MKCLYNRILIISVLVAALLFALSLASLPSLAVAQSSPSIVTVAAWNVQTFGTAFMSENTSVAVLIDSLLKWDITLIQEIRDISGAAIIDLVDRLNAASNVSYALSISPRLGYTMSKEQYAFIYRNRTIDLIDTFLAPDLEDTYSREPFSALFRLTDGSRFFAMPLHAVPTNAVVEINELTTSYNETANYFNETSALILGDFNADCDYVRANDWANVSLCGAAEFVWLIDETADTTTGTTDCAYDRFVATADVAARVVPKSVTVYNHTAIYNLTELDAVRVSDHYAIVLALELANPSTPLPSTAPAPLHPVALALSLAPLRLLMLALTLVVPPV